VSDVALTARVLIVPSPQFTVSPVTVTVLVTVKVTITVAPVFAGFGVGLLTVTVGTPTGVWTVTEPVACPVEPLLSVAVTVIVKLPAAVYL
jgi:hypothetical protein